MGTLLAQFANIWAKVRLPFSSAIIAFTERYLADHPDQVRHFLALIQPGVLWRIAESKLLLLVNGWMKNTPALQDIAKRYFPNKKFRTIQEFQQYFPILDKDSYRGQYSLEDLTKGGKLPHAGSFYKSAGTSGHPTLWVESIEEELKFDKTTALIARLMVDMVENEYVILNCWALGSWPTGINFFASARFQGKIVNLGTNIKETLEAINTIGPKYRYLLVGYPPFVYHIICSAAAEGIDFTQFHFDVITGGEGFVEEWRDALMEKLGKDRVIFSVYGSTDKGLGEGLETNFAYAVRSLLYIANKSMQDELAARHIIKMRFGYAALPFTRESAKQFLLSFLKDEKNLNRVPMVFQFDPTLYYNENLIKLDPEQKREVSEFVTTVLSPIAVIPRVRYNIHDEGRVMRYEEVAEVLRAHNISLSAYNPRHDPYIDLKLPFLLLFGRSDGTVSVDGANIFPQDIEECLRNEPELFQLMNSFQLFVTPDYRLGVAIELNKDVIADDGLPEKFRAYLSANLPIYSLGYGELAHEGLPSANIKAEVHPFESGPFTDRTLKMKYVRR